MTNTWSFPPGVEYKVRPSKDITPYRWEQGTLPSTLLVGVEDSVEYVADLDPNPFFWSSRRFQTGV